MIALSLASNDIKGLILFERFMLDLGRPGPDEWHSSAGEWRGVHVQIHRWLAGVLHEVMVLVKGSRRALAEKELIGVVAGLPEQSKTIWEELVRAANNQKAVTLVLLRRLRNSAAFHYDDDQLAVGYASQFAEASDGSPPSEARKAPQFCLGGVQETRFFYADAAAQALMMDLGREQALSEVDRDVVVLAVTVAKSINTLISRFLLSRGHPAPPPADTPIR